MLVAVTGGIGSGKSAVAARLGALGAVVVDADALAREVVEPGTPGLAAVVEEFGPGVLTPDGRLDRPAMAALVFADEERRRSLEAIIHPLVAARAAQLIAAAPPEDVVVYDLPLLAELSDPSPGGGLPFDVVVVVVAPVEVRVARLVRRGLTASDARARVSSQASDQERLALADAVVDNSGTVHDLILRVDSLWRWLRERAGDEGSGC